MNRLDARTVLRATELCRRAGLDLFLPGARGLLASIPGWGSLGLGQSSEPGDRSVSLIEAMRALELFVREHTRGLTKTALVATHPGRSTRVPRTRDALRTLVQGARKEILVLGYSITDQSFIEQLVQKARAGVSLTVVGDRERGGIRELLQGWPAVVPGPRVLVGVEPEVDRSFAVHGKVVVADRTSALIGSANFTSGGLRNNIELGVRVEGGPAEEICALVEELAREGWLITH